MTGGENRYYSYKKAKRAKRIDAARSSTFVEHPWYDNLHQYSKNKIHCSCPMCSSKTRNKGNRRKKSGNYSYSIYYKVSDLKKIYAMENDLIEEGYSVLRHRKRDRFT